MDFVQFCVGVVITILVFLITLLLSLVTTGISNFTKDENIYFGGWLFSTFGFGICLTVLLYQNGIIK